MTEREKYRTLGLWFAGAGRQLRAGDRELREARGAVPGRSRRAEQPGVRVLSDARFPEGHGTRAASSRALPEEPAFASELCPLRDVRRRSRRPPTPRHAPCSSRPRGSTRRIFRSLPSRLRRPIWRACVRCTRACAGRALPVRPWRPRGSPTLRCTKADGPTPRSCSRPGSRPTKRQKIDWRGRPSSSRSPRRTSRRIAHLRLCAPRRMR